MIRVPTLIQAASAAGKKTAFVSGKDNMVSLFAEGLMIGLYHGQHGSRDDSDTMIPIICFGSGIPAGAGMEPSDLRCIAPIVCRLMDLSPGSFDLGIPALLETQDRILFGR